MAIKLDYSDAPECVKVFLNYKLVIQNRSKLTVHNYYHDLRTFARFLLIKKKPEKYKNINPLDIPFSDVTDRILLEVKSSEIFEFLSYTASEKDNGASARARKLSCLRSFYKYHTNKSENPIAENPTERIESPQKAKTLPKYLSLDESISLLENIDGKNTERDFAIITLFLNCGMRVSELVGISFNDISDDMKTLTVTGKGNKQRKIFLNGACIDAIKAYLKVRPKNVKPEAKNALFVSRNRNRISVKTVQWLIYKRLKEAGLESLGMSVHKLRHTAATLMYVHGGTDVRVLKDILGHEDLSTTQIYTHISDVQLQKAAENNPLAGGVSRKKKENKTSYDSDDGSL